MGGIDRSTPCLICKVPDWYEVTSLYEDCNVIPGSSWEKDLSSICAKWRQGNSSEARMFPSVTLTQPEYPLVTKAGLWIHLLTTECFTLRQITALGWWWININCYFFTAYRYIAKHWAETSVDLWIHSLTTECFTFRWIYYSLGEMEQTYIFELW